MVLQALGHVVHGPRQPIASAGADTRPVFGPPRPPPLSDVAGQAPTPGAGKASGLRGLMKRPNFKRNALIGAGVIAAASIVQSKRSSGTSRGSQSMYRY